ncbi:unnamed protein product [Clonostachys chloroleuca]|uniref:EKC/KEOPS complex subunit BUD32 n=1 Tax=Clonostachys chloroleuca TaxID=1926264 RepID=A0AA35QBK7_9HYPO|nr:unnamed protein product [Clonostachys chloroleuca]
MTSPATRSPCSFPYSQVSSYWLKGIDQDTCILINSTIIEDDDLTFDGHIEVHESLHKAGFLHRDISINNLMINEDNDNPSWPSFLIDLDLAIKEQREGVSGAKGKSGTRAFMAIGVLLGEQHSFVHDLESFFLGIVLGMRSL